MHSLNIFIDLEINLKIDSFALRLEMEPVGILATQQAKIKNRFTLSRLTGCFIAGLPFF